jgi:hypothetical protein
MAGFLLLGMNWLAAQPAWLALSVGVASGGLVYGVACLLLGIQEVRSLLSWLARRLGRPGLGNL